LQWISGALELWGCELNLSTQIGVDEESAWLGDRNPVNSKAEILYSNYTYFPLFSPINPFKG